MLTDAGQPPPTRQTAEVSCTSGLLNRHKTLYVINLLLQSGCALVAAPVAGAFKWTGGMYVHST